jgi:outer membrane lipoprotein SlyB
LKSLADLATNKTGYRLQGEIMIRTIATAALLSFAIAMPIQQTFAQDVLGGALLGGAAGAIIGGAATGRGSGAAIGAAIGATTGAMIASEGQRRRAGGYWYRGRCYIEDRGNWYQVSQRYC